MKSVNEKQLLLYYGIGKYISQNSRNGFWGKGAIDTISAQLDKELPGLRGFSSRSLRYMRTFYEEWSYLETSDSSEIKVDDLNLELASAKFRKPFGEDQYIDLLFLCRALNCLVAVELSRMSDKKFKYTIHP